ncbi:MAG TPA: TetR family transcriptional regulator [Streptosporangiaceae bacterium]|nr:TetR family transcriptional regulator [Streptosporangiaceae bacterium]
MTVGRSGRRAGESRTRESILEAARNRFGRYGYDGATIRGIAADAEVDPALVHHFYGTKERLFVAAMRLPVVPSEAIIAVLGGERLRLGEEFSKHAGEILVRNMLTVWETGYMGSALLGLLRSAPTNDQALTMLREFVTNTIMAAFSEILGKGAASADAAERRYRAGLVASQVVGLGFTRYLLKLEPLAAASIDELVAAIGPNLQRFLTGDLSVQKR